MTTSLYSYGEVEAKIAKPQTLTLIIKDLLRADGEACYAEMEPFLRGAANTGSTQFDHANAVGILMLHDKKHGGRLHIFAKEKKLTDREVWDRLNGVLDRSGFKFANGKLVGLHLEDKRGPNTDAEAA